MPKPTILNPMKSFPDTGKPVLVYFVDTMPKVLNQPSDEYSIGIWHVNEKGWGGHSEDITNAIGWTSLPTITLADPRKPWEAE